MLVGQGIDIVSVKRIEKLLKKYNKRFIERIFSHSEIKELEFNRHDKEINFLKFSNRFAAKEAASKALGTGMSSGVRFKDIEIFNQKNGKPFIQFQGSAKKVYRKLSREGKKVNAYLSMSNENEFAVAIVSISLE